MPAYGFGYLPLAITGTLCLYRRFWLFVFLDLVSYQRSYRFVLSLVSDDSAHILTCSCRCFLLFLICASTVSCAHIVMRGFSTSWLFVYYIFLAFVIWNLHMLIFCLDKLYILYIP